MKRTSKACRFKCPALGESREEKDFIGIRDEEGGNNWKRMGMGVDFTLFTEPHYRTGLSWECMSETAVANKSNQDSLQRFNLTVNPPDNIKQRVRTLAGMTHCATAFIASEVFSL